MSGNLFYPRSKTRRPLNPSGGKGLVSGRLRKTPKQMERYLKGIANHRRIEILFLIAREEGISVAGISDNLKCNFKTISEHIRKLTLAGLIEKRYEGHFVRHSLLPYGQVFLKFLISFSNSAEFENDKIIKQERYEE